VACRRLGVDIRPQHAVTKLNVRGGRVEDIEVMTAIASAGNIKLSANHFVIAAGCWSAALIEPLGIKLSIEPCRGQMMEFDSPADLPLVVRAGHHYLVPRPGRRVLVGTTAEYVGFDKSVTGEGMRSILEGVQRIAPLVKDLKFRRAWSGLRPDTADHLPILGLGEIPNLFFATGHFRNGILLAPMTAQLISELILKGSVSQPLDAYRPTRFAS
jgi:glycine/D-amino acid oxidase-like deaminating enzyme